jgi:DNA-3-methyladenine glycosylase I
MVRVMDDTVSDALRPGADGRPRCFWAVGTPDYLAYHDQEWGRPLVDDARLFERLTLEAFQSGLSWLTILRKREAFRAAFAGFDIATVAAYGGDDVQRLLADAGIVRNRRKIEATIVNAGHALGLVTEYGSLAAFLWRFRPVRQTPIRAIKDFAATTPESTELARELKKRGFRHLGPTTLYASMQAGGIVNDHVVGCCVHDDVEREQRRAAGLIAGRRRG